ncbi:hypothetical protein [Chitinophaga cymbidii]|uniref:Uncharacterized protein n=1 Tax=Chitinophaga cymbidii TaxID=1096750 RepID=A0A512RIP5_9BACT|nr:hypothetical protein [Chitinophaga cymbidii]GEP95552.1 hypothetical protein CCY01nite_18120 [Chitinophaga cymbidii]
MNFTEEHIPVMEQHRHHWTGLRDVQVMRNLDRPVIDSLQKIYNEAVGPQRFTPWCSECVADLVRLLYTQFEKWEGQQQKAEDGTKPPAEEGNDGKGTRGRKPKNKPNGN